MRLGRALEERDGLVAAAVEQLLGEAEVEDILEEAGASGTSSACTKQMIDAGRRNADSPIAIGGGFSSGSRRRPSRRHRPVPSRGRTAISNRIDSPCPISSPVHSADGVAGASMRDSKARESSGWSTLKANRSMPDASVVANRQAVMVAFVPALEEDAVLGALADVQTHDLGVIRSGKLKIRHGDVHMAEAEDSHM